MVNHPHPLIDLHYPASDDNSSIRRRRRCKACRKCFDGAAAYIGCEIEACKFWLHKRCAEQPLEISHPFHPQHHKLELLEYNPDEENRFSVCDACFCPFYGFCYFCSECDFFLHLSCASSTMNVIGKGGGGSGFKPEKVIFRHAGHCHILILYQVQQIFNFRDRVEYEISYPVRCGWCTKPVSLGNCYGCVDCGIYLHEDCAFKVPFKIRNPCIMSGGGTTLCIKGEKGIRSDKYLKGDYDFCRGCSHEVTPFDIVYHHSDDNSEGISAWSFHGTCISLLIPSLQSEHHSDHHLTYFDNVSHWQLHCDKCGNYGRDKFNGFYGCVECNKNFHLSCILDETVTHKYHPHSLTLMNSTEKEGSNSKEYICDICKSERHPNECVYSCKEQCGHCTSHIECAINQERPYLLKLRLTRPVYEILKFLQVNSAGSRFASGVNEKGTTKEGSKAQELEIIRWPHEPSQVHNPLYSHHHHHHNTLILKSSSRRGFICDVCGELNHNSSANYKCQECSFIIDIKCASQGASLSEGRRRFKKSELRHFSHHHKLHLAVFPNADNYWSLFCYYCNYDIAVGLVYYCFRCNFGLHQSCLEQLPQKISLPLLSSHSFEFKKGLISHCLACGSRDDCIYYGNGDKFVHSVCALSLRRPLIYKSHDKHLHHNYSIENDGDNNKHLLYYFGKEANLAIQGWKKYEWFECRKCGECCLEAFYRCVECGVNFHLECVPIPRLVKTMYHRHHVKLVDSFLVQGYDLEDQYCDVCEGKIDPRIHAYYCEECTDFFVAHIDCILSNKVEEIQSSSIPPPDYSGLLFNYKKIFGEQPLGFKVEDDFVYSKSYSNITFADFHPIKPWILLVSDWNSVEIWNFQTQRSQWKSSYPDTTPNIVSARFILHENWIVVGVYDGLISVHDEQRLLKHEFTAHEEGLCYITVHPFYRCLFSFSKIDGIIKAWEMEEWDCIMEFHGHRPYPSFPKSLSLHPQLQVAFNPQDPDIFATGSNDDYLMIWNDDICYPIHAFRAHSKYNGIISIEFFVVGDELYLLGGLGDGKVKIWDYKTRSCIFQLDCGYGLVAACAHPKLPIIISCSPSSLDVCLMSEADARFAYQYQSRRAEHGFYIGNAISVACRRESEFILLVCSRGVFGFKVTRLEDPSKPEIQFACSLADLDFFSWRGRIEQKK